MKKILNIIKKTINILTNLTIIFFVIIWIYYTYQLNIKKVEEEKIFDYSLFIVTTGSMQNAININDIIVVKKTQNIEKGDIIAFEEDESLIVHRIIKKTQEEIITKGDALHTASPLLLSYFKFSHSASLKPTRTLSPLIRNGLFTSIPSVARSLSCSSSLISGNLFFSSMDLYNCPLVLKNFFSGKPLFSYHSFNSS